MKTLKSLENFELIIGSLPGAYLVIDLDLNIVAISDECERATLTQREQIIGKYLFDVLPGDPNNPEGFTKWRGSLDKVIQTLKPDIMPLVNYSVKKPESEGGGFTEKYWQPANYPVLGDDGKLLYIIHQTVEVSTHENALEQAKAADRKRLEAEAKFDFTIQSVDVGYWQIDLSTGLAVRNLKHDQLFGYNELQREWSLEHALMHFHPEDREFVAKAHNDTALGKGDFSIECRLIWPDKSIRWISSRGRLERNAQGVPINMGGIVLDITESKRILNTLKENETRFRSLADSIPQLAWMTDGKGFIYWYNQNWFNYTGMTYDEMKGWGWKAVHHPDSVDEVMSKWSEHLKSGLPWEDTFRLRAKDGRYRWFLSRAQPTRDEQGHIIQWTGSNTDINDQVLAEAELKNSQNRYETLTLAIPQLVWSCLADGSCNYLSRQWADFTGIPSGEQLGLDWLSKVIHPDDRERTYQHWMGAVSGKHPYDIEYRIRRHDGTYRWFKTRGSPMRNDLQEIILWVGTCTDIHDQKIIMTELEVAKLAAEEASISKSHFLANMSHEIRTPIGAIMGFTDLLKNSAHSDSDRKSFMAIIERNSQNLLRLIDDILDLSKVEAGKITLETMPIDLPDFLAGICAAMNLRATEKGINFSLSLESQIPDKIVSDPLRLKQIFNNIVGNAIKFTSIGSVHVRIDYEHSVLKVRVIDTGAGIEKENQHKLFQAFSQADNSHTRKFGGTGLGLVLSKNLSKILGGDLRLEQSEAGQGSIFYFEVLAREGANFSLVGADHLNLQASVAPHEISQGRLSGLQVLLVEDSPDNRTLITTYFKKTGVILEVAEDGFQGVEKAILNPKVDVILMDIQMPHLDGHGATQKLRSIGFTKPIIALTAHAMREEKERCIQSGFTNYLTKPIDRNLLIETLEKYTVNSHEEI